MKKLSVILSVVALVLSLFSLYVACMNPTKDSTSNLIATLGVICTVLIGWQIFSFIDFRSQEKKMSELESRLLKDEKRIIETQEQIIKSQKTLVSVQESILGTYKSMSRSDGAIYDGIANIYRYFREFDSHAPSDFLCQEILWHLADFDTMLEVFSPRQLREILAKIQNCLDLKIPIPKIQKDILLNRINDTVRYFEKSKKSSDDELREVVNEALSLIQSIPS
ncbi:MAG: hypothetical protein K2M59_06915 [Muribaculaceae bacterium]|nr:hypothetical protein [Muribaculaceae bacterium]